MRQTRVGSDRIQERGEQLLVHAAHQMPHWKVTKHRPTLVIFEETQYVVVEAVPGEQGRATYVLEPWRGGDHDIPADTIEYDEDYVTLRDEHFEMLRRRRGTWRWLKLAYPFVGFLTGPVKLRLEERYGFDPVTVTRHSMLLQFFVATISIPMMLFFPHLFLLEAALWADLLFRYDQLISETRYQFGFFEWLVRPGMSQKQAPRKDAP